MKRKAIGTAFVALLPLCALHLRCAYAESPRLPTAGAPPLVPETGRERQSVESAQRGGSESTVAGGKNAGAATLKGRGSGGGKMRPPEFFMYVEQIQRHIKSRWRRPDTLPKLPCRVMFDLDTAHR